MGRIRNEQWGRYKGASKGENAIMHGSIYIKDLSGNIHNQAFRGQNYARFDDNKREHAEDVLIREAVERWSGGGMKMQSAKVTIAMKHSPCIRCYNRIRQSYQDLHDAICGGSGQLYLVFAFTDYYVRSGGPGGRWAWASAGAARVAYAKLAGKSGTSIKESETGIDRRWSVDGSGERVKISNLSFWHEPPGKDAYKDFVGTWVEV